MIYYSLPGQLLIGKLPIRVPYQLSCVHGGPGSSQDVPGDKEMYFNFSKCFSKPIRSSIKTITNP